MERRAELEHPLGLVSPPAQLPPPAIDTSRLPAAPVDFVLEVGTEELPPDDVVSACEQLRCAEPKHRQHLTAACFPYHCRRLLSIVQLNNAMLYRLICVMRRL